MLLLPSYYSLLFFDAKNQTTNFNRFMSSIEEQQDETVFITFIQTQMIFILSGDTSMGFVFMSLKIFHILAFTSKING